MKRILTIIAFVLFLPLPVKALTTTETAPYIWQKEVVRNISSQAADLRQKLSSEVQKIIAAGHLAPYRLTANESHNIYLWHHAGDQIYALSEAYKYLPDSDQATKTALANYLKQEITNYPPYVGTKVYDRAPWLPLNVGTRREYYPIPAGAKFDYYTDYQWMPVIHTFYQIWNYVDATGDTQLVTANWSKINSLYDKVKTRGTVDWMDKGGCTGKYSDIAGCVGMARLAKIAGNTTVQADAESKANQGYNAGLNFSQFNQNSRLENYYFVEDGGDDANSSTAKTIQSYVFLNLFPETARFIRENTLSAATSHLNFLVDNIPTWNLTYGQGFVGGEVNYTTPLTSHPMFQAHAQILRNSAQTLRGKLDVPLAKVGDLYYIQNLVSTIKAYGQSCWQDIKTGTTVCDPVGTQCVGDLDGNGEVDLSDYSIVAADFFKTTPSNPKADINSDGSVDLTDYSLLAKDFFQSCS